MRFEFFSAFFAVFEGARAAEIPSRRARGTAARTFPEAAAGVSSRRVPAEAGTESAAALLRRAVFARTRDVHFERAALKLAAFRVFYRLLRVTVPNCPK